MGPASVRVDTAGVKFWSLGCGRKSGQWRCSWWCTGAAPVEDESKLRRTAATCMGPSDTRKIIFKICQLIYIYIISGIINLKKNLEEEKKKDISYWSRKTRRTRGLDRKLWTDGGGGPLLKRPWMSRFRPPIPAWVNCSCNPVKVTPIRWSGLTRDRIIRHEWRGAGSLIVSSAYSRSRDNCVNRPHAREGRCRRRLLRERWPQ